MTKLGKCAVLQSCRILFLNYFSSRTTLITLIQDFESLQQRPGWLDTVPCLVVKSERRAFKDDACIKFIEEYKHVGAVDYRSLKKSTGYKKVVWGETDV